MPFLRQTLNSEVLGHRVREGRRDYAELGMARARGNGAVGCNDRVLWLIRGVVVRDRSDARLVGHCLRARPLRPGRISHPEQPESRRLDRRPRVPLPLPLPLNFPPVLLLRSSLPHRPPTTTAKTAAAAAAAAATTTPTTTSPPLPPLLPPPKP